MLPNLFSRARARLPRLSYNAKGWLALTRMYLFRISVALFVLSLVVLIVGGVSWIFMVAWNASVVRIFDTEAINMTEALFILVIIAILKAGITVSKK